MLLNVGPDAKGNIPKQSLEILSEVGSFMKSNGDSIYNCTMAGMEKPDNGRITRNGNKLYYHIMENAIGGIPLYGVSKSQIKKIRLLSDGSELKPLDNWIVNNYPDIVFVNLSNNAYLPNPIDTVVEVLLKDLELWKIVPMLRLERKK